MKYHTAITNIQQGREFLRGHAFDDVIKHFSFAESIFLILRGRLPEENEKKMFNAMLSAAIDHGPGTASGQVVRIAASAKNDFHTSVAAGILAMGERHGGAIEGAAKFFQHHVNDEQVAGLVKTFKQEKIRIPGYGHSVLTVDHRSEALFVVAREAGFFGKHCEFALAVHAELNTLSSKPLPINIDGTMAAILSDMGFDSQIMKGIFIIARVPGLVAHIYEEITHDIGLRRLSQDEIEYVGE